jgi:uncharacterized membrane protein
MPEPPERTIEQRLQDLEATVQHLQHTLKGFVDGLAGRARTGQSATSPRPLGEGSQRPRPMPRAQRMTPHKPPGPIAALLHRGPQYWIGRVGIGLLLVGVAFLFNYAVDQGWLTPRIRIAFGLGLGGALATIGFRVPPAKQWFSQLMLGGAAATWYITGFAAFQLFELVSHSVAFAFMVLVTLFTFSTGIRQNGPALAVLGAAGGLGTPFFLYTDVGSVPGLVTYTGILLVGTSAIYLLKGWRSLLWTTAVGGWTVLALGFQTGAWGNRVALQIGVVVTWLLFWGIPVLREALAESNPSRWQRPPLGTIAGVKGHDEAELSHRQVAVLTFVTAVVALFTSRAVWSAGDTLWGLIALGGGVLYAAVAWRLDRVGSVPVLVSAHHVTGAVLVAGAVPLLFEGHAQFLIWAALAATLLHVAHRLDDDALRMTGHLLFGLVALWMFERLAGDGPPRDAVFNARALTDLAAVAAALVGAWWAGPQAGRWYRLAAHAALLAWLWRELSVLPAGTGIVTAAWGIYALVLILLVPPARTVGLVTLFLPVAKLILVDLRQVEAIWRILLFLGFGGVFLAIGYYFRSLWNPTPDGKVTDEPGTG